MAEHHDLLDWHGADTESLPADQRRKLAQDILALDPQIYTADLLSRARLLLDEDFEWWVGTAATAYTDGIATEPAEVALRYLSTPTAGQADLVDKLATEHPAAQPLLQQWFSPERIAAAEADRMSQEAEKATRDASAKRAQFDPDRLSAAVAAGDWAAASRELRRPVGDTQRPVGAAANTSPGWKQLSPAAQADVVELAASFVTGLAVQSAVASAELAADAFLLVANEAATRVSSLDPDVLVAILDVVRDRPGQISVVDRLVAHLTPLRGHDVERLLLEGVARDASSAFALHIGHLGEFTSSAVEDALADLAGADTTVARVVEAALIALIARDASRGRRLAFAIADRRPETRLPPQPVVDLSAPDVPGWLQAVHAYAAVIKSTESAAQLDTILARLSASAELAYDVIMSTSSRGEATRTWSALTCDQLATLYLWARSNLPQEPDYPASAVIDVNPVYEFPNDILRILAGRVHDDAIGALNRIADQRDSPGIRSAAVDLANKLRELRWEPPDPAEILEFLDNPVHAIVTSEHQLAELILDALDDIQADLSSSPDLTRLFWHRQADDGTWQAMVEPEFGTLLTQRLREKLPRVTFRQEDQLNLPTPATQGSLLDIEAVVNRDGVEICVIIEVKCTWHGEVRTAVDTQLSARYLGSRSSTGIYVVGAYASDAWDKNDWKRTKAMATDPDELTQHLDAEASRLSTDGKQLHTRVLRIVL
jgi:hypothetical protein